MTQTLNNLSQKDHAYLVTARHFLGDDALELLSYLPQKQSAAIQNAWEKSHNSFETDFQNLPQESAESFFYHCEVTWILEALQTENTTILAIALQELDPSKVGSILKELPKETRKALKEISLEKIAKPIQIWIQQNIKSRFPKLEKQVLVEDEILQHSKRLNLRQKLQLIRELGISEMAMAFSKINRSAIKAILMRLKTDDAKELRKRIKKKVEYPKPQLREAQLHILSLDFGKLKPDEIIEKIGFGVLSRAFSEQEKSSGLFFVYQFPPRQGYLLKRYLDENMPRNTPTKIAQHRQRILDAIKRLPE